MSVIIKDMEVPQYCGACHVGFCKQIGCELYIGFDDYATSRHPDCPISNIPTPHGRLIDADNFIDRVKADVGMVEEDLSFEFKDGIWSVLKLLETQPTVAKPEG